MPRVWIILLFSFTLFGLDEPGRSPKQRRDALADAILAPCCYAKPISRDGSSIALEMRAEVARLVDQGKTDREVIAVFTDRYGSKILAGPHGAASTWAHTIPVIASIAGLMLTVLVLRKMLRPKAGLV